MELLLDRRLDADRRAPGSVRSDVRRALAQRVSAADLDDVLLVVCELVTNSVLHVGNKVCVRLCVREAAVRCEVEDSSSRLPITRRALSGAEVSGRGLPLVDRLSSRWGADPVPGGKVVWIELDAAVSPRTSVGAAFSDSGAASGRPS